MPPQAPMKFSNKAPAATASLIKPVSSMMPVSAIDCTLKKQDSSSSQDDTPAIDSNFDFVNFPNLSVDEQIASIPPQFLQDIEFENETVARSHPKGCLVRKHPENHHGSWACDKVSGATHCQSGITGFYQSKGIEGWRCASCDWDLCIKCMKVDKFIQMVTNRED